MHEISHMEWSTDDTTWHRVHRVIYAGPDWRIQLRLVRTQPDNPWSSPPVWTTRMDFEGNGEEPLVGDALTVSCSYLVRSVETVTARQGEQTVQVRIQVYTRYSLIIETDIDPVSLTKPLLPGGGEFGRVRVEARLTAPGDIPVADTPIHFSATNDEGVIAGIFTDLSGHVGYAVTAADGRAVIEMRTAACDGNCVITASASPAHGEVTAQFGYSVDTAEGTVDLGNWQPLVRGRWQMRYRVIVYTDLMRLQYVALRDYPVSVRLDSIGGGTDLARCGDFLTVKPAHGTTDAKGILSGYVYYDSSAPGAPPSPPEIVLIARDEILQWDFQRDEVFELSLAMSGDTLKTR